MATHHSYKNEHLKQQQERWLRNIWELIDKTMNEIEPPTSIDPIRKRMDEKFHAWRTIPHLQHRINMDSSVMGLGDPVKVFIYWNTVRSQKSRGKKTLSSFDSEPSLMMFFTSAPIIPPRDTDSLDCYEPTLAFPGDWNLDQKREALSHHKYV